MSQKCKLCFLLYLKEIYAQFVETNGLVKQNIYQELNQTIMDLDLHITRKHPVVNTQALCCIFAWCLAPLHLKFHAEVLQFVMVVLRKKLETKIAWTEWICLQSKPSQQHIETG